MGFFGKLFGLDKDVDLPESLVTDNYRIDITYRVTDSGKIESRLHVRDYPGNVKHVIWLYKDSGSDYYSQLYITDDSAKRLKKRIDRILSKTRDKINKIEMNIRAISHTNYDVAGKGE